MLIKMHIRDDLAQLLLEGYFDFNSHKDFRESYGVALENPAVKVLDINFSRVDYIDSSALGMLLILREKAADKRKTVILSGLHGAVRQVLDIANFGKLFTMHD